MKKPRKEPALRLAEVSIRQKQERAHFLPLTEVLVLLLFSVGMLLTLEEGVGLAQCSGLLRALKLHLILPFLLTALFQLKRRRGWALLGLLGVVAGGMWIFRAEVIQGGEIFRAGFIGGLRYLGIHLAQPAVSFSTEAAQTATAALLIPLLTVFLTLAGYAVIRGRSFLALLFLEAPFLWMAINLAQTPMPFPLFCMALSLFMAALMSAAVLPHRRTDPAGSFSAPSKGRIRRMTLPLLQREGIARSGRAALVMGAALLLIITSVFPRNAYRRPEVLLEMDRDPVAFFEANNPFSLMERKVSGGISGGSLSGIDRVDYTGEPAFRLTEITTNSSLYLKGYAGSVYTGSGWQDLPDSAYNEISELLQDREPPPNYGGDSWFGTYLSDGPARAGVDCEQANFIIEALGVGRKYLLTPYGFFKPGNIPAANYNFDRFISGDGNFTKYPATALIWRSNGNPSASVSQGYDWPVSAGEELAADFRSYCADIQSQRYENQQTYVKFAEKYYTALPETGLEQIKADYSPQVFAGDLTGLIEKIRSGLRQMAVYDLAPGRVPAGKDFVEYFLYENRRGYCSHFATAATLMFRAAGIPARYAEGFVVTQEDYARREEKSVTILDKNAHAWPEIYVAPFGWVPVEVTPGVSAQRPAPPVYNVSSPPEETASASPEESGESGQASALSSSEPSSLPQSGEATQTSEPSPEAPQSGGVFSEAASSALVSVPESGSASSSLELRAGEPLPKTLQFLLFLLGILLLGTAAILLRRQFILRRRAKRFGQADTNQAAIEIYRYCLSIWGKFGRNLEKGKDPMAFARRIETRYPPGRFGAFASVTALAQEAKFGGRALTAEEVSSMREFAQNLARKVYIEMKPLRRKVFRWLEAML